MSRYPKASGDSPRPAQLPQQRVQQRQRLRSPLCVQGADARVIQTGHWPHTMKRVKLPLLLALILGIAVFWLVGNSRAAAEMPEYKVIRTDEKYEIRDYPALSLATTPMKEGGMNGGFGQLFKFISGENQGSEKIEMTAPVLIDTSKETKTMSFIMPRSTVQSGVPQPAAENVKLAKMEAARFAVLRFEGGRTKENEQAATEKLSSWLEGQKIAAKGEPLFAYYDPPWTPVFLCRNEVMIRIDKRQD